MLPDTDFETVPISELTTPRSGKVCLCEHWWSVTEDECVLFYTAGGVYSPQCNTDKSIVERLGTGGTTPRFIPVAYVKQRRIGRHEL